MAENLTQKTRLDCIRAVIERDGLTAQQKCVGVKLILEADKTGESSCSTIELMHAASAKDRKTVFAATKQLTEDGFIKRTSDRGAAGCFKVLLPQHVVEAVVEAYDELKSGAVQRYQSEPDQYRETGPVADSEVVPSGGTRAVEPHQYRQTTPVERHQYRETGPVEPNHPSRVEDKIYNNNINLPTGNNTTSPPELVAAREGEEAVGFGVVVNCETIKHPHFLIPLKAIELQLCGAVPMDRIKSIATGHAIQWATDIAAGKDANSVVPKRLANYLASAIKRAGTKDLVDEIHVEKVRAAPAPRVIGGGRAEPKRESTRERRARALGLVPEPAADASTVHRQILELTATEVKS